MSFYLHKYFYFLICFFLSAISILNAQTPNQDKIIKDHILGTTYRWETFRYEDEGWELNRSTEPEKHPLSITISEGLFNDSGNCYERKEITVNGKDTIWKTQTETKFGNDGKPMNSITIDTSFGERLSHIGGKDSVVFKVISTRIEKENWDGNYSVRKYTEKREDETFHGRDRFVYGKGNKIIAQYTLQGKIWIKSYANTYDAKGRLTHSESKEKYEGDKEIEITDIIYFSDGGRKETETEYYSSEPQKTRTVTTSFYDSKGIRISQRTECGKNVSTSVHFDTVYFEGNGNRQIEKRFDENDSLSEVMVREYSNGRIYREQITTPGYGYKTYYYTYKFGLDSMLLSMEMWCTETKNTSRLLDFMKWQDPSDKGILMESKKYDNKGNIIEDVNYEGEKTPVTIFYVSYTYGQ
jgi:hypothetical protein